MTRKAAKRSLDPAATGVKLFDPRDHFPGCVDPGPDLKAIYADSDPTRLIGGIVVLMMCHRGITTQEAAELLRKQAAALRAFADGIDAVAIPVTVAKGGTS